MVKMVKISRNVTVDVEIYTKARIANINLSAAAEEGMRSELARLGHGKKSTDELFEEKKRILLDGDEKKRTERLRKFMGLPLHVVNNLKKSYMKHPAKIHSFIDSVNNSYNKNISPEDVIELVPRWKV